MARTLIKIEDLQFNQGLIPAIAQDADSGEVLMLAYMNREALEKTLETGMAWYYSRSRQSLWLKGETSGHHQLVKEIRTDCDQDAILLRVVQQGREPVMKAIDPAFTIRWRTATARQGRS